MWKKLTYTTPFFLSFTQENGYCIYITDFIKIWWVNYSQKEFLSILKKSNDDLEMENDDQLLEMGLKMLLYPETLKKLNINFEEKLMSITMTLSCGFPVYLDIKLTEGSREMFFTKITQQLLKIVADLKSSEDELRISLIKKDKEIEEYKSETDVRLAMYLKTGMFHNKEHMSKHPMYEKNFGIAEIPSCLLEKDIVATKDQVIIKQENVQTSSVPAVQMVPESQKLIKTELESVEPESEAQSTISTVKREIKSEPLQNISPKKKPRKILKI